MWCVMRLTSWHRDKCDDGHSHPGQQLSCQLSQNSIRWFRVKNNLWSHSSEIGEIALAGDQRLAHYRQPAHRAQVNFRSQIYWIGLKSVTQIPNVQDIFKARSKVFVMPGPVSGDITHHGARPGSSREKSRDWLIITNIQIFHSEKWNFNSVLSVWTFSARIPFNKSLVWWQWLTFISRTLNGLPLTFNFSDSIKSHPAPNKITVRKDDL